MSNFIIPCRKGGGGYGNSLRPSVVLSVLPSHIFVRSISPKVFEISTSNFTSGYISLRRQALYKNHYSMFSIFGVTAFCTFFFWNFCPEHISKSMKARNLKLHTHIELIEQACSAQDPLLCLKYFQSYCPFYIFTLNFWPEHISKSIKARNLKLHTYIELIEEKCIAQQR